MTFSENFCKTLSIPISYYQSWPVGLCWVIILIESLIVPFSWICRVSQVENFPALSVPHHCGDIRHYPITSTHIWYCYLIVSYHVASSCIPKARSIIVVVRHCCRSKSFGYTRTAPAILELIIKSTSVATRRCKTSSATFSLRSTEFPISITTIIIIYTWITF